MTRNRNCPRNKGKISHLALERQENVTERFTDEGHLLERQPHSEISYVKLYTRATR